MSRSLGRILAARVAIVAWLCVALWAGVAAQLAACGGSDSKTGELESEVSQPPTVTVPTLVCDKNERELIMFASYKAPSPACDNGACSPSCSTNADCPGGTTCTNGQCQVATCASDADCAGDTHCNLTTSQCELVTCSDDSTCPCGSYCDSTTNRCRLDCLDGADTGSLNLSCSSPLQCDGRGRCSPKNGDAIPTQPVVLASTPSLLQMTPDASSNWPTVSLTISISTASQAVGIQAPSAVRVEPAKDLLVACNTTDTPGTSPCTISGWTYALDSTTNLYLASRAIRVNVASGTTATEWPLTLESVDGIAAKATVEITAKPAQQEPGMYAGSLTLGTTGQNLTIPVQAVVTSAAIELVDASRIIAPTGAVLVNQDGSATVTSFLGGRKDAALYNADTVKFQLQTSSLVFDPIAGQLVGTVSATVATSPQAPESWSFVLLRNADLVTSACASGLTLDSTLGACVPGTGWDPASDGPATVTSTRATAWLNAMAPHMNDALLVSENPVEIAEKLVCLDHNVSSNTGFLVPNQTLANGVAGDLQCADPNSSTGRPWWGVGLISKADRPANGLDLTQFDMLSTCIQEIMRGAPSSIAAGGIANNDCISLERFYPALFATAGQGPYRFDGAVGTASSTLVLDPTIFDRRRGLLFERLLQQWTQLAGFIARNGTAQRDVADMLAQLTSADLSSMPESSGETGLLNATQSANLTYGSVLDAVDNAWTLILDQRIHDALVTLPAGVLASPDYRQFNRPISYWTFNAADGTSPVANVVGGPPLVASGSCSYTGDTLNGSAGCSETAAITGLDHDLTVALNWTPVSNLDFAWSGPSTLVDSDAIVIKELQTAAGPLLQVGHRIANGSVELVSVRIRSGHVVVRRDMRTMTYLVDDGQGEANQVFRAPFNDAPSVRAGNQLVVGASQTASSDNLKGMLTDVAIWDSLLAASEAHTLAVTLQSSSSSSHAAWPTEVALPAASNQDANEAAVGVPAVLLESLIPTMGAIQAYVKNASTATQVACRRGFVDDGLEHAKERAARSLRLAYAVEQIAVSLYAKASAGGPPAWSTRYSQAVTELGSARFSAIQALTNAVSCDNPMGLGPKEFPLYFGDGMDLLNKPNIQDVLEATAENFESQATAAIATASGALTAARTSWVNQYNSAVQQVQSDQSADDRVNDIATGYGRSLIDLCGIADVVTSPPAGSDAGAPTAVQQSAATVLDRFINPSNPSPLTAQNCHIQETSACQGNENTALAKVNPTCFRGQIGEAWLATESARERVTHAQIAWSSARATADGWIEHCVDKEISAAQQKNLLGQLQQVEDSESAQANAMGAISGFVTIVAGAATAASGGGVVAMAGGMIQLGKAIDDSAQSLTEKKDNLNTLIQDANLDSQLQDCDFQASQAAIPVDAAAQDVTTASADLNAALTHAMDLQNQAISLVTQAGAALAREAGRARPRIAFNYWADENLAIYDVDLARARRLTYLYLRAVEHDLQRNLGLDDAVLGAVHPQQLTQAANTINAQLQQGFETRVPDQLFTVLSLCTDVLHLPPLYGEVDCSGANSQSQARLREILFSPQNAVYDSGVYLGQAIPFTLTPGLAEAGTPGFSTRCAENISKVDVHFVGQFAESLSIKVAKREQFFSETCANHIVDIGPTQDGVHRSSNNLLLDGTGGQFGQDAEWVRGTITALSDSGSSFVTSATPSANAIPDFAGRGLYGNYQLIVPPEALGPIVASSGGLEDIKLRFDFISIEDSDPASAVGNRQLTVELDDGNGAVLPAGSGNSVTSSCTSNSCASGSTATLTASAASGWHFAEWGGACTGFSTTCNVPMLAARKVWATFVQNDPGATLSLSNAGTGSGGVAVGWSGGNAAALAGGSNLPLSQSYASGTAVTLTPVAPPDQMFTGWSGGGCSGTGACTVTLAAATGTQAITASFAPRPKLTLQVNLNSAADPWRWVHVRQGSASGPILCDSVSCVIPFSPGQQVVLAADPTTSTTFGLFTWSGGGCTGNAPCTVTMNGDTTVQAVFRTEFQVTVTGASSLGTVTAPAPASNLPAINCGANNQPLGNGCSTWLIQGQSITLNAIANSGIGARFFDWNGAAGSCTTTVCTVGVNSAISLSALFTPQPHGGGCGANPCQ